MTEASQAFATTGIICCQVRVPGLRNSPERRGNLMHIQTSMRQSWILLGARAGSSAYGFPNVLTISDVLWNRVLWFVGEN